MELLSDLLNFLHTSKHEVYGVYFVIVMVILFTPKTNIPDSIAEKEIAPSC
jgi:hypothetical protein